MKILANAFSINMLNVNGILNVQFEEITSADIPADVESQIGHKDMADLLTNLLSREVKVNRANCKITVGDELYVAQYIGPRLAEGAIDLPEGAEVKFFKVTVL